MCVIYPYPPPSRGGRGGSDPPPGWGSFVSARAWRFEKARIGIGYNKTTIARNRGTTAPAGRVLRSGTFA
jgi:hypothetical protein